MLHHHYLAFCEQHEISPCHPHWIVLQHVHFYFCSRITKVISLRAHTNKGKASLIDIWKTDLVETSTYCKKGLLASL